MKFALSHAAAFSILALGTVAAQAADLTYEPAPPVEAPAPFNWNGLYLGIHGGYGGGDFDTEYHDRTKIGEAISTWDSSPSGAFGGFQVGYNYQFDRAWLLGVEADFSLANLKDDLTTVTGDDEIGESTISKSVEVEWFGTLRGRAGYVYDRALIYATGGAAYGSIKGSRVGSYGFGSVIESVSEDWSKSETKWGWTVGAGAEFGISKNVTLKLEYLYVDLGSVEFGREGIFYSNDPLAVAEFDAAFHTVNAGLNYKF